MLVCSTMIFSGRGRGPFRVAAQERRAIRAAVEPDIDVAVAGDLHRGDAGDGADLGGKFRGDLFGRLAELARQLKGDGNGELAELALPRLLDGYRLIDAIPDQDVRTESAGDLLFNGMEHGMLRVYQGGGGQLLAAKVYSRCDVRP